MGEVITGVAIAILSTAVLTIFSMVGRRLMLRKRAAEANLSRIMDWQRYIDAKLDLPDYNPAELDVMEKEISFQFSSKLLKKYTLKFGNRFVAIFLASMGIKKKHQHDVSLFCKYARLDDLSFATVIELQSSADHRHYSHSRMPFGLYWNIILGNYLHFHNQYRNNWKNQNNTNRKYTMADIEIPIRLLRIYFKK